MANELYYFEYVDKTAEELVAALSHPPEALLRSVAGKALEHAEAFRERLHVEIAGLDISKEVAIALGDPDDRGFAVVFPISWHAANQRSLFPSMQAELEVVPLSDVPPYSQLGILGTYRPPAALVGRMGDAVLGHRIAQAAVRRFISDLAERLS